MANFSFAPYQSATFCSHIAQPGNIYLAAFIEEQFPETRLLNIESCRDIVGGSALSHHAEGRANDEGVPQGRTASGVSVGHQITEMLGPYGKVLGIDHIIDNLAPWQSGRGQPRTYSAASPQGKVYTGLHPHKDHNHIGLTRYAAVHLTLTTIRAVVLGAPAAPTPVPPGDDTMEFLIKVYKGQTKAFYRAMQAKTGGPAVGTPRGNADFWGSDYVPPPGQGRPTEQEWRDAIDDFVGASAQIGVFQ